ncbi:hypothetical protein D3C87_1931250 [compost metagenome]
MQALKQVPLSKSGQQSRLLIQMQKPLRQAQLHQPLKNQRQPLHPLPLLQQLQRDRAINTFLLQFKEL